MAGIIAARKRLVGASAALCCAMGACSGGSAVDTADVAAAASTAGTAPGRQLFSQNCAPCHRDDGNGTPNIYPSLHGSAVVNGDPVELAQWVLLGTRPHDMAAGRYSTRMLLFGWMKDPDAAAVLTYVRSHFDNSSPPVEPATVATAR